MIKTSTQIVVIDDHRVVGLGVKAAFEDRGADASISWAPTVREARWKRGQVAVLDLRLADGSAPDKNIAYINGYGIPRRRLHLRRRPLPGATRDRRRGPIHHPQDRAPRRPRRGRPRRRRGVTFPTPDWAAALDADEDFVAEHLSDLEAQILAHYASGESSASVARALSVSKNTVNTYIARIRDKYRESGRPAESRVDLFRRAAEDGLVSYYD